MVRCAENIVNDDVLVSFHFVHYFRELDDFERAFSLFWESIWDILGHRILILGVLEPCLKSIYFSRSA